jgi:AraC-like DNA-binding protein
MHLVRSYVERPVRKSLEPLLVCAWIDPAVEQRHPVLPDACIDIVWNGSELHVAGPATGPSPILGHTTYLGIRFQPGVAPSALGVAASELLDRSVPLRELWGASVHELEERLAAAPSGGSGVLEEAILARRESLAAPDPLISQLLHRFSQVETRPAGVETLAAQLGVSERTLRRRCEIAIGYGPKTLQRILRFRHGLRLVRDRVPLVTAAQWAGYVDQAHLSYEFQRLAGATPGEMRRGPNVVLSSNGWPVRAEPQASRLSPA